MNPYRRFILCVNKLCIDNLSCSAADIIHLLHPQHLIFSLKLFRYIFFFRQLFYQPGKHFLCLFVNNGNVTVQLAWMYTKKVDKCVRIRDKKKTERKSTHV